jgi:dTDP-4-amino-4,6-dideoxygalactose transaminase
MKFIDLAAQQARIRDRIDARIRTVLDHGQYIMGPEVGELECELAGFTGVRFALGCASGTDALLMALMAKEVGPGDAVFTSPFTFIATAEVVSLLGATPVFVDIDPATFNLSPEGLERAVEAVRTGNPEMHPLPANFADLRPRGIIGVDLFGLPAEYDAIQGVADRNGLFVIEDAAQSFGAEYKGRRSCGLAEMGCTSFFPAKPLGAYGDGGAVFTDDEALAERMVSVRVHGQGTDKYDNDRIGINGRLDAIQAAVLLVKMEIFPEEVGLRQAAAERYTRAIAEIDGLIPPSAPDEMTSVYAQYSVLARDADHRAAVQNALKAADIPSVIYYPKPLHRQRAFAPLGYAEEGQFPVTEDCSKRIFSLPMHPYLTEAEQERVVEALRGA